MSAAPGSERPGLDAGLEVEPYPFDESLPARVRAEGRALIALSRPRDVLVVLGRGSDASVELELDAIRASGVRVARRRGGGCSVVLDPGNVVIDLVLPIEGVGGITTWFSRISTFMVETLGAAGLPGVDVEGTSDLALSGRKIAGSCIHRAKGILHYSLTLLAEGDVALIERYLRHPPREPGYRAGRRHRDFVVPIGRLAPELGADELIRRLSALELPDEWPGTPARVELLR